MSMRTSTTPSGGLIDAGHAPAISILGPTIQFLTPPDDEGAPCIMRGTIPPGVSIPLHSHGDPETFVMISGAVEGVVFDGDGHRWLPIRAGDIFHVPGHAKHAWRNAGRDPAVMLIVSTSKMGRFFGELASQLSASSSQGIPSPEDLQRFNDLAAKYGYWNASPEENARIGIVLPEP